MADPLDRELRQISASMDGESPPPADPSPAAVEFAAAALRLRHAVRVEEALVPPDVLPAVLAEVRRPPLPSERPARHRAMAAACLAFLVAAVTGALVTAPQWRGGDDVAVADVRDDVLAAQATAVAADLDVVLEEHGAHPDRAVRRYHGVLRWRAPEQLWLQLTEVGRLPPGWPANDLEVVVDDGGVATEGLRACPVQSQPGCLQVRSRMLAGLSPFAEESVELLDLVVPVAAVGSDEVIGPGGDVSRDGGSETGDGEVVRVQTTAGEMTRLLDALGRAGALRRVHPTDEVTVDLDADTSTLRRLTVRAAVGTARSSWAAANGYDDQDDAVLLHIELTPRDDTLPAPTVTVADTDADAGFVDDPAVQVPMPTWLPPGFLAHRSGRAPSGTSTAAYANGRAWIRVDWTSTQIPLPATAVPVPVGRGTGHRSPTGDRITLLTPDGTAVVDGSVAPDQLVRFAAGLELGGRALTGQPTATPSATPPDLPPGVLTAEGGAPPLRQADGAVVVVLDDGLVLVQRPGDVLPPPVKADVVEVVVRGTAGRWSAPLGLLAWGADGWVYELSGEPGADVDWLLAVAERLS